MLFENLENIYREKSYLKAINPFDETYILIRNFLMDEVAQSRNFISPYDYSLKYKKDVMESLNLFLSLSSNDRILIKYYFVECDQCGDPTIERYFENILHCTHCPAKLLVTDDIRSNKFSNVHYIFKINTNLLEEFKSDLKGHPSFSSEAELEGTDSEASDAPSTADIISHPSENLRDIQLEMAEIKAALSNAVSTPL